MHTPCARAVVCRYSPYPRVLTLLLLLLLLLCCTAGCLAAGHHRCMHDQMVQGSEQMAVVREIPRKGQGAVQAYTASAAITEKEKDKLNWTPIRIKAYTRDLDDPKKYCTGIGEVMWNDGFDRIVCTANGILTVRKKRIILEQALPAAIKMHAERISVVRETDIVKVPREDLGYCTYFHIPEEHHTIGLKDADLHLYVAAMQCRSESAWAMICGRLKTNDRPFIAAVNLDPRRVESTSSYVRVVAHEIGHALGFDPDTFPRLGVMGTFFRVRGREFVWMVNASKAKEVARKYFNCPTAEGLELESTHWGSSSHFSIRIAKGDMMGPGYSPLVYSELSLGVFDSMPFYRANFSMAEPLVWGKNAGCDFLEKKCLENGVSPNPEFFCNRALSSDMYFCTPDRMGLGYCTLKTYNRELPEPFQYFKDKRMGGDLSAMDYCPYVEPYSDTTCTSGFHLQSRGSFIGENARCVKGVELDFSGKPIGDVCVNTKCDNGTLSVQFLGDGVNEWRVCKEKEEIIPTTANLSGKIICPRYDAVCTKLPDITIPLEELPYQDGDYKPAPANITWDHNDPPNTTVNGIGDGSVTAAGHASLLLLFLVSAVTVGVSL